MGLKGRGMEKGAAIQMMALMNPMSAIPFTLSFYSSLFLYLVTMR